MKKLILALIAFTAASMAHADQISLANIDTNDANCGNLVAIINTLNSSQVSVQAQCSDYGYYQADNGTAYNYRLYTTVTVPGPVVSGTVLHLGNLDVNDCDTFKNIVNELNMPKFTVDAECSPYVYQGYPSNNGKLYNFRITTTVTAQ